MFLSPTSLETVTAYAYPEEADDKYFPDSSRRTAIRILKKDGSIITVSVKDQPGRWPNGLPKSFLEAMKMNGGGLVNENPQGYVGLVKWTLTDNIFQEIDVVRGSKVAGEKPLVPYYSAAIWPSKELNYGDKGYFIIVNTGEQYKFSADDTCPKAKGRQQIDFWLGIGKEAYDAAVNWGMKQVDLYVYR